MKHTNWSDTMLLQAGWQTYILLQLLIIHCRALPRSIHGTSSNGHFHAVIKKQTNVRTLQWLAPIALGTRMQL